MKIWKLGKKSNDLNWQQTFGLLMADNWLNPETKRKVIKELYKEQYQKNIQLACDNLQKTIAISRYNNAEIKELLKFVVE
jgi:hypothetical protein